MKNVIAGLIALLSVHAFGQGSIQLGNSGGTTVPVLLQVDAAAAPEFKASPWDLQLFLVSAGGALTGLTPTTLITANTAGSLAVAPIPVLLPFGLGSPASFMLRAWDSAGGKFATYESAASSGRYGFSEPFTLDFDGAEPPIVSPQFIFIPEPATWILLSFGATILALIRFSPPKRRSHVRR